MRHDNTPNDQLALTSETLLGVATPWMVVCVPEPAPVPVPVPLLVPEPAAGPPLPAGAVTGLLDPPHPANRAPMAMRHATPSDLTRSFLNIMCIPFAWLCSAA